MPLWGVLACGVGGLGLAIVNVATMRRLWASQIFERPQKLAQSVLVWVVPGSVFLVRAVLGERHQGRAIDAFDPTVANASGIGDVDSYGSVGSHYFSDGHGGGGFGDGGGGDGSVGSG